MRPSFIRVEADELTYNLHIMLRFEIEQDLIEGRTEAEDLPAGVRQRAQRCLQLVPSNLSALSALARLSPEESLPSDTLPQ